jgi:hypothetical protein
MLNIPLSPADGAKHALASWPSQRTLPELFAAAEIDPSTTRLVMIDATDLDEKTLEVAASYTRCSLSLT